VLLQKKLGIAEKTNCACFDIRQQCSAFIYGLQMADAFVRTGMYQRVLLIGAELHSHSLDYSTRGRDVMVLFGDGAGAMVLGPMESDDPRSGVIYTSAHADGTGAMDLYLKIFDISRRPFVDYDARDRDHNEMMYPHMEGKRVFLHAVRGMVTSTQAALARTGLGWDDIQWSCRTRRTSGSTRRSPRSRTSRATRCSTRSSGTAIRPRPRCRSRSITGDARAV